MDQMDFHFYLTYCDAEYSHTIFKICLMHIVGVKCVFMSIFNYKLTYELMFVFPRTLLQESRGPSLINVAEP